LYDPRIPVESKRLTPKNEGHVVFDRHPVYPGIYEVRGCEARRRGVRG
jgi:hypothetical protein